MGRWEHTGLVQQAAGIIGKLRHYIHKDGLASLYYAFVQSHLQDGILSWGCANNSEIQPLQILQNKILRIMSGVTWKDKVTNNSLCSSYQN